MEATQFLGVDIMWMHRATAVLGANASPDSAQGESLFIARQHDEKPNDTNSVDHHRI